MKVVLIAVGGTATFVIACGLWFLVYAGVREKVDKKLSEKEITTSQRSSLSLVPLNEWVRADASVTLGKGSFGTVFAALNTSNGKQFAVKEIDLSNFFVECAREESMSDRHHARKIKVRDERLKRLRTELEVMRKSRHPHIVAHLGQQISVSKQKLYIFMELMSGGTLRDILDNYGPINNGLLVRYASDIMSGLDFLHTSEPTIVHRDIKPANILLTRNGIAKLGDFGAAEVMKTAGVKSKVGTVLYSPPEMHDYHTKITPAYDIWSLGVTLHEMITGDVPFPVEKQSSFPTFIKYITQELSSEGFRWKNPLLVEKPLVRELVDLLDMMLKLCPDDRPSTDAIRGSSFFRIQQQKPQSESGDHDNVIVMLSRLQRHDRLTKTVSSFGCREEHSITLDSPTQFTMDSIDHWTP